MGWNWIPSASGEKNDSSEGAAGAAQSNKSGDNGAQGRVGFWWILKEELIRFAKSVGVLGRLNFALRT